MGTAVQMQDVKARAAHIAHMAPGADVSIIGTWIWATFPGKPSDDIRAALKEAKFRWNARRHCWQWGHSKGVKSPKGREYLAAKYGEYTLTEDD